MTVTLYLSKSCLCFEIHFHANTPVLGGYKTDRLSSEGCLLLLDLFSTVGFDVHTLLLKSAFPGKKHFSRWQKGREIIHLQNGSLIRLKACNKGRFPPRLTVTAGKSNWDQNIIWMHKMFATNYSISRGFEFKDERFAGGEGMKSRDWLKPRHFDPQSTLVSNANCLGVFQSLERPLDSDTEHDQKNRTYWTLLSSD